MNETKKKAIHHVTEDLLNFKRLHIKEFLLFILLCVTGTLKAQTRMIEGTVRDSITREVIPYVSVYYKGTDIGVTTDEKGRFHIELVTNRDLVYSSIGYIETKTPASKLRNRTQDIWLTPSQYQLQEIVIKPKREKYTRKGNPAVEFVQQIIRNKNLNDPLTKEYYSFKRYEKLTYAINDFDSTDQKKWLGKKFNFLNDFTDTSVISGKTILPLSIKEMVEETYYRKSPRTLRKRVEAYRKNGIEDIISGGGMDNFFSETFKEVDIYKNDISLFLIRFTSPLSSMGPVFYKYYLNDTVIVDGVKCRDVSFVPASSESLGFTGHLYVTLDSTYFVQKAVLNVPEKINLNYIDRMVIVQDFERTADSTRFLKRDDVAVEMKLMGKFGQFYARRINMYSHPEFEAPNSTVFEETNPVVTLEDAKEKDNTYWVANKDTSIVGKEDHIKEMLANMRKVPLYYYGEKVLSVFMDGYIPTAKKGSIFDIGPFPTLISANSFEGMRLRFGGVTTTALSKRWFSEGYVAYGTKDEKLKYRGQLEYSFIDKKEFSREFPVHSIRASYLYDAIPMGQQYKSGNSDNIFSVIRRSGNENTLYLRKAELNYKREHYWGLSYELKLRNIMQFSTQQAGFNQLLPDNSVQTLRRFDMTEAEIRLRYSPGEKFYQMKDQRMSITRDAHIFYLSHITAFKGFMGTDYTYNRTEIGFDKRFWLSSFGSVGINLNVAKVWNKVPYPLLITPNSNLSYTIQPQSYALLNPVEFILDEFASWDVIYNMSGYILNRIPLIQKLKLRELVTFRGFFGDLNAQNIPVNDGNLFIFPENVSRMKRIPYMETSVGVTNLLKIFRIEYVWRLTYLDHPNIDKSGIRVGVHFSF